MHQFRRFTIVIVAIAILALASSCSSGSSSQTPTTSTTAGRADMRDLRYCEVLLVSLSDSQPIASVYNTYPLNECPEGKWAELDPKALATQFGATVAMLNGPRHWMINSVEKIGTASNEKADFGGIEMYKQATVPIGSLVDQARSYSPYSVSRSAIFTYYAGTEIFELTSLDGSVFVMQSFSQQKDPSLTLALLPSLANKLELPAGWKFGSRMLTEDLKIVTVKNPAQVLQDNLGNSYSMIPSVPEN
jgi:hypothetical protein